MPRNQARRVKSYDTVANMSPAQPPPLFEITIVDEDGSTVVVIAGDLDIVTVPALVERLATIHRPVVIDLHACSFLDSTGLGALLRHQQRTAVAFTCMPTGPVRRIIELMCANEISLHPTRWNAAAALKLAAPEDAA